MQLVNAQYVNYRYCIQCFFVGCAISRCLSTTPHPMNRATGNILLVHYSMIIPKPATFCFNDCLQCQSHLFSTKCKVQKIQQRQQEQIEIGRSPFYTKNVHFQFRFPPSLSHTHTHTHTHPRKEIAGGGERREVIKLEKIFGP